jgi:hypothetical protein
MIILSNVISATGIILRNLTYLQQLGLQFEDIKRQFLLIVLLYFQNAKLFHTSLHLRKMFINCYHTLSTS